MEPLHFSKLLNTLDEPGSSKDKKVLIQTTAASNTFTCIQIAQILEKFTFPKEQLKTLSILRSKISDYENTFQIVEKFTFTKDQRKASTLLGQPEDVEVALQVNTEALQNAKEDMPVAMEASAFLKLLEALSHQTFPKEQFYLVELAVFRNTFTVAQVKQILEKFKFPSYQLKALKILRYQITDPENHFLLLSTFSHTLSKKKACALLL